MIDYSTTFKFQPRQIFLPITQYEKYQYLISTKTIVTYPGYLKQVGPDGKTWFEKRYNNYLISHGSGNKSKRRLGYEFIKRYGYWTKGGKYYNDKIGN